MSTTTNAKAMAPKMKNDRWPFSARPNSLVFLMFNPPLLNMSKVYPNSVNFGKLKNQRSITTANAAVDSAR